MRLKKSVVRFLFIILAVIIILIGYRFLMVIMLKSEVKHLEKLDFTVDKYDSKIKTMWPYSVVEKSIKSYYQQFANDIQNSASVSSDERLVKVLSYDNYQNDGPEFKESLSFLNGEKEKFVKSNEDYNNNREDKFSNYVKKKTRSKLLRKLAVKIVDDSSLNSNLQEYDDLMSANYNKVNSILNIYIQVLNFLKERKDAWQLEDNQIKFAEQSDLNTYNDYIARLAG